MKIGDIVKAIGVYEFEPQLGIVVGFVEHTHPKESHKVTVLSNGACVNWIIQYCQVVFENRANEP